MAADLEGMRGSQVEIIYPATVDGMIAAFMAARVVGEPEDIVMEPYTPGSRPKVQASRSVIIAVGAEAAREAERRLRGSAKLLVVSKRGEDIKGHAGGGLTYSSSLSAWLKARGHPVMAAASIVSVAWSLSRSLEEYRRLMAEAGMDPLEDYWIAETVALNLLSVVESCRQEGLKWYPRLMAMDTVEPVKAVFEDALLASLRAQADYEARRLAEEADRRASTLCGSLRAVRLEADWDLGVSIAKIMRESMGRDVVVAFRARCSGSSYVVLATSRSLGGLSVGSGYVVESFEGSWVIAYSGGEGLERIYRSLVSAACSGRG